MTIEHSENNFISYEFLGKHRKHDYIWLMLTRACCLAVGYGLELDLVSGRLVVVHTYLSTVTLPLQPPASHIASSVFKLRLYTQKVLCAVA